MTKEETTRLVLRLRDGDRTAFAPLFEAIAPQALRTACFLTGDKATAEDALQDTFVSCLNNLHKLREAEKFRPWFYRALTRRCTYLLRARIPGLEEGADLILAE